MKQQINLYQSEFQKKWEFLSIETLFVCAIGLIVVLGGIYWFSASETWALKSELKELESKVAARTEELAKISQASKSQGPHKAEVISIESLKKQLEKKRLAVNKLRDIYQSDSSGFSRYFESFSRNVLNGLWLSEFSIYDGGSEFEIKGRASEAKLVLAFIENLSKDVMFSENDFSTLEIVSGNEKSTGVSFIVNTGLKY